MLDVLSENIAEGLIMTVLKENNIELSENDLKQRVKRNIYPVVYCHDYEDYGEDYSHDYYSHDY